MLSSSRNSLFYRIWVLVWSPQHTIQPYPEPTEPSIIPSTISESANVSYFQVQVCMHCPSPLCELNVLIMTSFYLYYTITTYYKLLSYNSFPIFLLFPFPYLLSSPTVLLGSLYDRCLLLLFSFASITWISSSINNSLCLPASLVWGFPLSSTFCFMFTNIFGCYPCLIHSNNVPNHSLTFHNDMWYHIRGST